MSAPLARVRDTSMQGPAAAVSPGSTTTIYSAAGDAIQAPLAELRCPRCLRTWEWPRGLDPDLDRRLDLGSIAECPECLDELTDLRLADFPWEADG